MSKFPERGDALKKNAQLPALDEKVPVDETVMTGSDNTETYFMAGNTEGDDSGVTLDSIRMESASVREPPMHLVVVVDVHAAVCDDCQRLSTMVDHRDG